jgi:hypothetical protein
MHHKELSLHQRTTLASMFPTDYLDKLTAHQCHVINLHQKHEDLSGQMGNTDETQVIFYMLTHATTRTKKIKISSCQNNRT